MAAGGLDFTDLDKARLDYAWKWFEHHAKQRVQMFNFFLLVAGVAANAYVLLWRDGFRMTLLAVNFTMVFCSLAFLLIDVANRRMLNDALNILENIENSILFPVGDSRPASVPRDGPRGPVTADRGNVRPWYHRHTTWIRGLELLIAACFVVAFIKSLCLVLNLC